MKGGHDLGVHVLAVLVELGAEVGGVGAHDGRHLVLDIPDRVGRPLAALGARAQPCSSAGAARGQRPRTRDRPPGLPSRAGASLRAEPEALAELREHPLRVRSRLREQPDQLRNPVAFEPEPEQCPVVDRPAHAASSRSRAKNHRLPIVGSAA